MTAHSDEAAEFKEFISELERVCPEAVDGLAVKGLPPPPLSRRELIVVLRSLPDRAGVDEFMSAWYERGRQSP